MSKQLEQQLELARPFPPKYVHGNPSGGGTYVKHHVVNQRLIEVFGTPPDFKMIEIVRGDVAELKPNPQGNSKRAKEGAPALTNVIVGVVAEMSVIYPGDDELDLCVTVQEAGDCEEPHNWKTDGARLKDAMSDAYKRCGMRLGCALHLWSGDEYFLYQHLAERNGSAGSEKSEPQSETGSASQGQPVSDSPRATEDANW